MPIVVNGVTLPSYADPADVPAAMRAMSESLLPKSGGTMIGLLNMGANRISGLAAPTSADDATHKGYVDGVTGAITWLTLKNKPTTFPPSTHEHAHVPRWTTQRKVTLTGDATGAFNIRGDADVSFAVTVLGGTAHAHNQYVEKDTGGGSSFLPITGGTLTGGLVINGGGLSVEGQATFRGNMLGVGTDSTTGSLPAWKVGGGPNFEFLRQTSSRRHKRDISDADPSYIDRLLSLRPVNYKSRIERDGDDTQIGLIAEEVHQVAPEFTYGFDEKTGAVEAVSYEGLIVPLLMTVQWLAEKVKTLEAKVAT